jgi:polysaccharide export outer membrane protein
MKTSTTAPFAIVLLLMTAALAPAQTRSASGPSSPAAGAPGSTPAASPARASSVTNTDYRLVPGDKLKIEVYKDAQLSQALQVRPDGKITLPLIGDIAAEGRTSTELRDALVTSLKEYNTNPIVTVIVVETVPPMFYVMGEVNAAGSLPLKGQVTVLQALAMAGGFKDFAKTKDIVIQRKSASGISTLKFNYNDAVKGKGPILYLQPGDTIIVP